MNKNRELKFHQTLNLPPRSVKGHGKHRRTRKKTHRDPADGAGDSAGGSITWYPGWTTATTIDIADPDWGAERAIPYAGVRTGELIGWRAWWVINDHDLRSLAHHFVWQPGSVVEGDINKFVEDGWSWARPYWLRLKEGVYAHFERFQTIDDVGALSLERYPVRKMREKRVAVSSLYLAPSSWEEKVEVDTYFGLVIGRVKMWGEVVEHERGYRAQFARVLSLDQKCGVVDLEKLRQKYLP